MFDVGQSVAAWRVDMARGGACAGADLDELEGHLRESVEKLVGSGLSSEEAFLVAVRRMGGADDLRPEYGKTYPERVWRERVVWMLAGCLAWQALSTVSELVSGAGLFGVAAAGVRGPVLGWTALATDVLAVAMALVLATLVYRGMSRGRLQFRPGIWVGVGVGAIVAGRVAGQIETMGFVRVLSPAEFGALSMARVYLWFGLSLVTPIVFGLLALRLGRKAAVQSC